MGVQKLSEDLHAAVDGLGKVLLLGADDLGDIGLTLAQLRIMAFVLVHDRIHDLIEERTVDAKQLAVAGGSSQQAAQHVAAALVAGQHAVADHKGSRADVVGDDAQGHVFLAALAVARAGDLRDLVGDVHDGVDVEQGVNVLAGNGKTLEAHAGVDVLLLQLGIGNVVLVDKQGALCPGQDWMNPAQADMAEITNKDRQTGNLAEIMKGKDVFIGVSAPNIVTAEMVASMATDPIVFAMANPTPEIMPEEAKKGGVRVMATGRSDYPNQINNVLVFPGIFRGALDAKATGITEEMKMAAAKAIASIVTDEELNEEYIIPGAFDDRVAKVVAKAVADEAHKLGITK